MRVIATKLFTVVSGASRPTYLKAVVSPATELQHTRLLVKREILNINLAGRLVNGRRLPLDQALVVDGGLGGKSHLKVAVRTGNTARL